MSFIWQELLKRKMYSHQLFTWMMDGRYRPPLYGASTVIIQLDEMNICVILSFVLRRFLIILLLNIDLQHHTQKPSPSCVVYGSVKNGDVYRMRYIRPLDNTYAIKQ